MRRALALSAAIAVLALSGACDFASIEDYSCPPGGTKLTYDNFGRAFFAGNCNTCHSAETGDRKGAPENYAFDTLALIRKHKERIFARSAAQNDSMPPGPDDP